MVKTASLGTRIVGGIGGCFLGMVLGTCIAGPIGAIILGKIGCYLGYKYADF
jgi:hypothetical protein